MDRFTHFADDVIASHRDLYAESDFFEELAFSADGRNAEVGTAHINANGVVRHNG